MSVMLTELELRILAAIQALLAEGSSMAALDDVARTSGVDRRVAYEMLQNHRTLVRRGLVERIADEYWQLTAEGDGFTTDRVEPQVASAVGGSSEELPGSTSVSTPRVFMSYSHDTDAHRRWVHNLASRLRQAGIEVVFDAWDLDVGMDLAKFMERAVAEVDRVLAICTEEYVKKADAGRGGVGYEAMIVTSEIIGNLATKKFVPLIRQAGTAFLPRALGTRRFINFSDDAAFEEAFEALVRALHGTPLAIRPPLGSNPFAVGSSTRTPPSVPSEQAGSTDSKLSNWRLLLQQAKERRERVECDSELEINLGEIRGEGRSRLTAAEAHSVTVARVDASWFELGFALTHQGGITMVTVPFSMVADIWPGSEGRTHFALTKKIRFGRGKSTFV